MSGTGEAAHVQPDLGDHDRGGQGLNPGMVVRRRTVS